MTVQRDPAPWVLDPQTRTDFVRYQGASGDMNPIHHDQTYAEAAGYASPFSVGMLQAGLLGTYATDWLGADNIRSFRTRFTEQVWPGDVLTCTGRVTQEYERDGIAMIDVVLECARQTGGIAATAWATFVVLPEVG
ncbi:MaoC/PaaZ C-terminal domain-containing protein [Microbacterium panaciterrae]|uniref:MaoC-like domain-containing protein n=1 Tax=Microbacterium panaciterrae TaxID=985759 RepID=A0ABP8PI78_9MICO